MNQKLCRGRNTTSSIDRTLFIRNASDFTAVSNITTAIVYRHIVGGIANQLFSVMSAVLLAEMTGLPLICYYLFSGLEVDSDYVMDSVFTIHRRDDVPVYSIREKCTCFDGP